MAEKPYIAPLDGIRAIAILLVLLHQGSFAKSIDGSGFLGANLLLVMDAGWMGVQLFFVLSGFLITGILLDSKGDDLKRSFKHFYLRRSLRIFPIYYFSLLVLFLAAALLQDGPAWLENTYHYKFWFLFYLNNWITPFADTLLGHFWSLAVEEQFYLLWPLLVFSLGRRALISVCIGLIVLAPAFRYALTIFQPEHAHLTAYVWTPARLDALAIGALLAISRQVKGARQGSMDKIMLGLMLVSLAYMGFVIVTQYRYLAVSNGWPILNQSVCALLFVGLIYFCLDNPAPLNAAGARITAAMKWLLSLAALRSIGKHSYAIYVFHLPVSLLLRAHLHPVIEPHLPRLSVSGISLEFLVEAILLFAVTYGLARLSWILVEHPFLKLKHRWPM